MTTRGLLHHIKHDISSQKPQIINAIGELRDTFNKKSELLQEKTSPLTQESYENAFNKLDQMREIIKDTLQDIEFIKSEFDEIKQEVDHFSEDMDKISSNINNYYLSYGLQSLSRKKVKTQKQKKYPSPVKLVVGRKDAKTPHKSGGKRRTLTITRKNLHRTKYSL